MWNTITGNGYASSACAISLCKFDGSKWNERNSPIISFYQTYECVLYRSSIVASNVRCSLCHSNDSMINMHMRYGDHVRIVWIGSFNQSFIQPSFDFDCLISTQDSIYIADQCCICCHILVTVECAVGYLCKDMQKICIDHIKRYRIRFAIEHPCSTIWMISSALSRIWICYIIQCNRLFNWMVVANNMNETNDPIENWSIHCCRSIQIDSLFVVRRSLMNCSTYLS